MIGWHDDNGREHRGSLFATFAALARGEARSFPALRPHQREPWHAFTVQVAAMALIRAGSDTLPDTEAAWRDLLIALTPEYPEGEAWQLVVDDWSKPALLQPPIVPGGDKGAYKNRLPTPDALDMLVTAKNHDVKQERMIGASDEEWLFALVALQTASAYGGAKTYGASRMNGKTGSRLIVRVRPRGGAGTSFQRDVMILKSFASPQQHKKSLLWLEETDGTTSLSMDDFAPSLYIDCARRIRLRKYGNSLEACYATSQVARLATDLAAGLTGDPYAPVKSSGDASITPKRETFGYKGIARVLEAKLPVLAQVHESDNTQGLAIIFSALVRRGGTDTNTDGFFYRTVLTTELKRSGRAPLDRIGEVADKRAKEASEAGKRLRRALISLVQGGPDKARLDDDAAKKKTDRWLAKFDETVDAEFFDPPFWAEAQGDPDNHRMIWRTRLRDIASDVFEIAVDGVPYTGMRRIPAKARARAFLDGQMREWTKEVMHGE